MVHTEADHEHVHAEVEHLQDKSTTDNHSQGDESKMTVEVIYHGITTTPMSGNARS